MRPHRLSPDFHLFYFIFLLLSPVFHAVGEGPQLDWVKLIPYDSALAIAEDSNGNLYVGSGPRTALTKFDSTGNVLWTWGLQQTNSAGLIWGRAISIDASNNIYISGGVWGTINIGNFQYGLTSPSVFFAKLTPDRTTIFAQLAYN